MYKILYVDYEETMYTFHQHPFEPKRINTMYFIARTENDVLDMLDTYNSGDMRKFKSMLSNNYLEANGRYFGFKGSALCNGKTPLDEFAEVTAAELRNPENKGRFYVYDSKTSKVVEPEFLGHLKLKEVK